MASGSEVIRHHNSVLRRSTARAWELEGKLAGLLEPILVAAGEEAARQFERLATDHMAASAAVNGPESRSDGLAASAPGVTSLSTMVALVPRESEAAALEHAGFDGAVPAEELHVTLCFLGEYEGPLEQLARILRPVAAAHAPLAGSMAGIGGFMDNGDGRPNIAIPSCPGLIELRVEVTEALVARQVAYSTQYGYVPHMTVGYTTDYELWPSMDVLGQEVHFDDLWVVRGDTERVALPLTGGRPLTASAMTPADLDPHGMRCGRCERAFRVGDEYELEALEDGPLVPVCGHCYPPALTAGAAWSAPASNDLVDVDKLVSTLRTKTDPVRQAVVETTMKASLDKHGIAFDVTNPLTEKVLAHSGEQVTNIAKTTQLNVNRIVRRSYEEGLTIPDTAKAITAGMREAAGARATLIARTELVGAVNGGSLAATEIVSDATGTLMSKQWLTAPGAPNPRHEMYDGLNGQTVPLDAFFQVGADELGFPGDPAGSPEEVCNCRCTIIYTEPGAGVVAQGSAEDQLSPEDAAASAEDDLAEQADAAASDEGSGAAMFAPAADAFDVSAGAPEESDAVSIYQGGKTVSEERFEAANIAELNAEGESGAPEVNSAFNEMYGRLERDVEAATWSNPEAKNEAFQAVTRVGLDQVTVLRDDAGNMLGVVDYNPIHSVSELEDAVAQIKGDIEWASANRPEWVASYKAQIQELDKMLATARDKSQVVGVNHLASTGAERGVGARLMQQVAKDAAAQGRGVGLNSLPNAEGFYKRLGMTEEPPGSHNFYWTPKQAKEYADTGTVSGPAKPELIPPPPPPIVDPDVAAITQERPYSHWAKSTLDRQIVKSRAIVRKALEQDPSLESLTARERKLYDTHKEKLQLLLRERDIRNGVVVGDVTVDSMAPLAMPQSARMRTLKGWFAGRERRLDRTEGMAWKDPDMWVGYITEAGQEFAAEVESRLEGSLGSTFVGARREAIKSVLSEVRDVGTRGMNPKTFKIAKSASSEQQTVQAITMRAAEWYPREWLDKLGEGPSMKFKQGPRGYFKAGWKYKDLGEEKHELVISNDHRSKVVGDPNGLSVAIHELGHAMEAAFLDIRRAEAAFYEKRAAGEALEPYKLAPNPVTDLSAPEAEVVRPDQFVDEYMGKDYGSNRWGLSDVPEEGRKEASKSLEFFPGPSNNYELLSMGMESLFTGSFPVWERDPEMRNFILGLLLSI